MSFNRFAKFRGVLAALLIAATLSTSITAGPSLVLNEGRTTVNLSNDFLGALNALSLSAGGVGDSRLSSGIIGFPITNGALDLANAKGEINHGGGLFLATRTTRVELLSFNIDTTGATPTITGIVLVNGDFVGRIPLFNLTLPTLTLPLQPHAFGTLFIPGVKVALAPEAAAALNQVFGVTAFAGGFNIGTASVFAVATTSRRSFFGREIPGAESQN